MLPELNADPVMMKIRAAVNPAQRQRIQTSGNNSNQLSLMAKQPLQVKNQEAAKHITCADWAGVKILDSETNGPKTTLVLQFSDISKVLEMGGYLSTVTDAQVKEHLDKKKAEEKAQAKK